MIKSSVITKANVVHAIRKVSDTIGAAFLLTTSSRSIGDNFSEKHPKNIEPLAEVRSDVA